MKVIQDLRTLAAEGYKFSNVGRVTVDPGILAELLDLLIDDATDPLHERRGGLYMESRKEVEEALPGRLLGRIKDRMKEAAVARAIAEVDAQYPEGLDL